MRFAALVIGLLATFVSSVAATALTYRLEANEKACFYNYVDQRNVKLAFYFAVSTPIPSVSLNVGLSINRGFQIGPIRRFLRYRLLRCRTRREGGPGWYQGKTG